MSFDLTSAKHYLSKNQAAKVSVFRIEQGFYITIDDLVVTNNDAVQARIFRNFGLIESALKSLNIDDFAVHAMQ